MRTTPVLTFFNNKGGVGKTSLVYHVSWMLAELGHTVLVVDLDSQANLTAAFLRERTLERLWETQDGERGNTIYQCVEPLAGVGDIRKPKLFRVANELFFLAGDLALSGFEDLLSTEWPNCLGSQNLYRPFRVITSFWQIIQEGARQCGAQIVLVDVGPAWEPSIAPRSSLLTSSSCHSAADLFSRQGPPQPRPYAPAMAIGVEKTTGQLDITGLPATGGFDATNRLSHSAARRTSEPSGSGLRPVGEADACRVFGKCIGHAPCLGTA